MTRVVADITVSLDGYVTGPDAGPGNGLGTGGEPLHRWVFSDDPGDKRILAAATERSGAVVMGRNLFDVVDGPGGWSDELGYGATEVGKPPFVVVTSAAPPSVRLTGLDWTFVTTGLSDAVAAARKAAEAASTARGADLDAILMGGGALVGSALAAGLWTRWSCTSRRSSWARERRCSRAPSPASSCSGRSWSRRRRRT
ncbi:dihydrofolate reductase family protein [Leifsonia shinshuensis]